MVMILQSLRLLRLDLPTRLFSKIVEAVAADPPLLTIRIGNISELLDVWVVQFHELLTAHRTVVVVPGHARWEILLPPEYGIG
jgi:hypothetical protein